MDDVKQGKLLYSGKAKTMYLTEDESLLISEFRDDTSAFDGVKTASLAKKGMVNNEISTYIFKYLEGKGVPT